MGRNMHERRTGEERIGGPVSSVKQPCSFPCGLRTALAGRVAGLEVKVRDNCSGRRGKLPVTCGRIHVIGLLQHEAVGSWNANDPDHRQSPSLSGIE